MTKAYRDISNDKRHDLIRLIEKTHMSVKKAAEVLQINYSSAKNIVGFFNRTGILEKKPKSGNHTCKKLTDEEISLLRIQISENRRITLDALKTFVFNEFQKSVSTSAIWNYIKTFRQSVKKPYVRKKKRTTALPKVEKDIKGEEYLITEYPTEDNTFIVVVADSSGQNIFKKSGHIGDKVMLDFCGNTISYLICGRDDDGSIRQTKIFIGISENNNKSCTDETNEFQNEQDMLETNIADQVDQQDIINDNEEEYFISEETVVTNNVRKQLVTLFDRNHKVCDTKYGFKDSIVRLELSDKAFDYTIHGPIVTKLSFDKINGAVVQEEWKTDLGLEARKKAASKRNIKSEEPRKKIVKKKFEPTLEWEEVPPVILPTKEERSVVRMSERQVVGGPLVAREDRTGVRTPVSLAVGGALLSKEDKGVPRPPMPLVTAAVSLSSKKNIDASPSSTPATVSVTRPLLSSQHNGTVVSTILASKISPKSAIKAPTQPQAPVPRHIIVAQHNNMVKSALSSEMASFTSTLANVVRARKTVTVTTDFQG